MMTDYARNMLWKLGIKPVLLEVFDSISDNEKSNFHVEFVPEEELKKRVFNTYEVSRDFMKTHFFDVGTDDNLIDFHKVCSCLTYSLVKNRFLEYDLCPGISSELLLSNYKAAFLGGCKCLFVLCAARLYKEGAIELSEKLWLKRGFEYPPTNRGHDSYVTGRAKSLALNETFGRDFDYLAYSDMLFWIEKYNIEKLKQGN